MIKYLENVDISDIIKLYLMKKQNINFDQVKKEMDPVNPPQCDPTSKKEWVYCDGSCYDMVSKYMTMELESTAYILRILAASIITTTTSMKLKVKLLLNNNELDKLTGLWKDDSKYFDLTEMDKHKSRLIMGFGPSASGKTYWAKNIIAMLGQTYNDFPTVFITVDGGIFRDMSIIYQITVKASNKACHGGYSNLVVAGFMNIFRSSLFASDKIKKVIVSYLLEQSKKINISLYVPETLGDCGLISSFDKVLSYNWITDLRVKSCETKITPYTEITKDEKSWIGLLIWQHKNGSECNMNNGFKCVGCTESGMSREQLDGKKYDNSVWDHSMLLGERKMKKAPGGSYKFHNSGGLKGSMTTLEDYTMYTDVKIKEKFKGIASLNKDLLYTEHKDIDVSSLKNLAKIAPRPFICDLLPICSHA